MLDHVSSETKKTTLIGISWMEHHGPRLGLQRWRCSFGFSLIAPCSPETCWLQLWRLMWRWGHQLFPSPKSNSAPLSRGSWRAATTWTVDQAGVGGKFSPCCGLKYWVSTVSDHMGVDTEVEILVSRHWITGSFLDISICHLWWPGDLGLSRPSSNWLTAPASAHPSTRVGLERRYLPQSDACGAVGVECSGLFRYVNDFHGMWVQWVSMIDVIPTHEVRCDFNSNMFL